MKRIKKLTPRGWWGGSAGIITFMGTQTSLSSAMIKALPTTPITLVPAQGSGTMIVPLAVVLEYTFGTTQFTNPNGNSTNTCLGFANQIGFTGTNAIPTYIDNDSTWVQALASNTSQLLIGGNYPANDVPSSFINQAFQIGSMRASNSPVGSIVTAGIASGGGGTGYAVNDTGTINAVATYKVTSVSGGVVTAFTITAGGAGFTPNPTTPHGTVTGGAQPGSGSGFNITVLSVAPVNMTAGDGTAVVTCAYMLMNA